MQAFVTGSTGLLGNNLVRQLIAAGWAVTALARSREKAARVFDDMPVDIVEGDMTDVAGFADALAGHDVVFHCAAYFTEYRGFGDHWPKLQAINIDGTIELLDAALAHDVKKVIYTSSAGAVGALPNSQPSDESTPPGWFTEENLYFRSKHLSEGAVDEWLKTHDLPVVMVQPAVILGPGDIGPTQTGTLILDYVKGTLSAVPAGGVTIVDVRDAAQGMINAVECGGSGERYLLAGHFVTMPELYRRLGAITGSTKQPAFVPFGVLRVIAALQRVVGQITGRAPAFTIQDARFVADGIHWTGEKAAQQLNLTYRPLDDTLRDAAAWFTANGYVGAQSD